MKPKKISILVVLMVVICLVFTSCSSGNDPKGIATAFIKAWEVKYDAEKAVSYMSSGLVSSMKDSYNCATDAILINVLQKEFDEGKKNRTATVKYIDQYEENGGIAISFDVKITTSSLLGFVNKDQSIIKTVYLVEENGKYYVQDYSFLGKNSSLYEIIRF